MARYSPSVLRQKLESGIWFVKFTKVNGEIRRMRCTRDFKTLEKLNVDYVSGRGLRKVPDHQIVVWDLDKNQWRSFRLNSVIEIRKLKNDLSTSQFVNKLSLDEIKNKLRTGTWKIRFQLTSGDYYSIVCTRDFKSVLPDLEKSESSSRHIPDNQVIVWDLNADSFRSFRYDSIVSTEKLSDSVKKMWNKYLDKSKEDIESEISRGIWKFYYHKRDGTSRFLYGTKDPKILEHSNATYVGTEYPHLITVYDIEKKDFRNMIYSNIESMRKLKSFSSDLVDVRNNISNTIDTWLPRLADKYQIDMIDRIKTEFNPTDGESPAYCSTSPKSSVFTLNFDLDKINRNFPGKERFIAFHELCHVFADLIIDRRSDLTEDQKFELKEECRGHGPIFIDIMMTSGFPLTKEEFDMQYERHIAKYL